MPPTSRLLHISIRRSPLVLRNCRLLIHQRRLKSNSYARMTSNNTYTYSQEPAGNSFDLPPPPPYEPNLDAPAGQTSQSRNEEHVAQVVEPPPPPPPQQTYAPSAQQTYVEHPPQVQPMPYPTMPHEVQQEYYAPTQTQHLQAAPAPPPRSKSPMFMSSNTQTLPNPDEFAPPPRRIDQNAYEDDDIAVKYMRDPCKLVAYLVPFPKPRLPKKEPKEPTEEGQVDEEVPLRFLIYTPPPPPLVAPKEGEKETKLHMVQRRWQGHVKDAKTSDAKVTTWKGAKAGATKGINWAMNSVTSHSLDFMNRVPDGKSSDNKPANAPPRPPTEEKPSLNEMVLIYPASLPGTQEELRENFVNTMLRTKSKAQRDAVIATGLWPAAFGIDVLLTFVWPFGGLAEVDAAWAWSSMRGAKTARSVTKRLNDSGGADGKGNLKLTFTPSSRLETLRLLLADECHKRDMNLFPSAGIRPTDSTVLKSIGWAPSQIGNETRNWEDEQWELIEVKDDLQNVMLKASKDWTGWCKAFEKNPKKALKK